MTPDHLEMIVRGLEQRIDSCKDSHTEKINDLKIVVKEVHDKVDLLVKYYSAEKTCSVVSWSDFIMPNIKWILIFFIAIVGGNNALRELLVHIIK